MVNREGVAGEVSLRLPEESGVLDCMLLEVRTFCLCCVPTTVSGPQQILFGLDD